MPDYFECAFSSSFNLRFSTASSELSMLPSSLIQCRAERLQSACSRNAAADSQHGNVRLIERQPNLLLCPDRGRAAACSMALSENAKWPVGYEELAH